MIHAKRMTFVGLTASAALLFAGAPAAGAADCATASPTTDQYCPPSNIVFQGSDDDPGSAVDPGLDPLPFTGFDLGLAALAAVGLVGAGIGLHRAARAQEERA